MADRARRLEHQPAAGRSIGRAQRIVILGAVLALGASSSAVAGSAFDTICLGASGRVVLCDAVGKRSVTLPNSVHMPRIDLGTIIGVTWLAAGAVTGAQDPDRTNQLALRDSYYFMVEVDGGGGVVPRCFDRSAASSPVELAGEQKSDPATN